MKRGSFLLLMGKKRFARNRQCGFGKNGKHPVEPKEPPLPENAFRADTRTNNGYAETSRHGRYARVAGKTGCPARGRQKNRLHQRVLRHPASGACGSAGTLQGAGRCAGARAEQRRIGQPAGQGRRPARQSVSCAGLCAGASGKRGFRGPVRRGYAREAHRGRTARRAGQRRGLVRGSHRRPGIGATARR